MQKDDSYFKISNDNDRFTVSKYTSGRGWIEVCDNKRKTYRLIISTVMAESYFNGYFNIDKDKRHKIIPETWIKDRVYEGSVSEMIKTECHKISGDNLCVLKFVVTRIDEENTLIGIVVLFQAEKDIEKAQKTYRDIEHTQTELYLKTLNYNKMKEDAASMKNKVNVDMGDKSMAAISVKMNKDGIDDSDSDDDSDRNIVPEAEKGKTAIFDEKDDSDSDKKSTKKRKHYQQNRKWKDYKEREMEEEDEEEELGEGEEEEQLEEQKQKLKLKPEDNKKDDKDKFKLDIDAIDPHRILQTESFLINFYFISTRFTVKQKLKTIHF